MRFRRAPAMPALGYGQLPGPDEAGVTFDVSNHAQLDVLASVADFDREMRVLARRLPVDDLLERLAAINPTWSLLVARRGRPWTKRLLLGLLARRGIVAKDDGPAI